MKLTKKELIAVLAVYDGKQESEKKTPPALAQLLKAEVAGKEQALNTFNWVGVGAP
jgi:hypothetical protein